MSSTPRLRCPNGTAVCQWSDLVTWGNAFIALIVIGALVLLIRGYIRVRQRSKLQNQAIEFMCAKPGLKADLLHGVHGIEALGIRFREGQMSEQQALGWLVELHETDSEKIRAVQRGAWWHAKEKRTDQR